VRPLRRLDGVDTAREENAAANGDNDLTAVLGQCRGGWVQGGEEADADGDQDPGKKGEMFEALGDRHEETGDRGGRRNASDPWQSLDGGQD
jgi:hypothetical protein